MDSIIHQKVVTIIHQSSASLPGTNPDYVGFLVQIPPEVMKYRVKKLMKYRVQ